MRKIAATYVCIPNSLPIKNSFLVIDDDSSILKIVNTQGNLEEQAGLEFYSGFLVPGYIHADFERLKAKQKNNPYTNISDLMDNEGFELGTKPGIYLITGMDLVNLKLLPASKIKQLV